MNQSQPNTTSHIQSYPERGIASSHMTFPHLFSITPTKPAACFRESVKTQKAQGRREYIKGVVLLLEHKQYLQSYDAESSMQTEIYLNPSQWFCLLKLWHFNGKLEMHEHVNAHFTSVERFKFISATFRFWMKMQCEI